MGLEIIGTLHLIGDTIQVSERFTKREFIALLADNPKYPQLVQFQLTGDRCSQIDSFHVGDRVRLEFSLRGREWKSPKGEVKFFNSLDVWRVESVGDRAAPPPEPNGGGWGSAPDAGAHAGGGYGRGPEDDIPFATSALAAEPSPIAACLRGEP